MKNYKCYMCKKLIRLYVKGANNFKLIKYGWCMEKREIVQIHECCDKFIYKPNNKKISGRISFSLNGLLCEISTIRKLIEANCSENIEYEEL